MFENDYIFTTMYTTILTQLKCLMPTICLCPTWIQISDFTQSYTELPCGWSQNHSAWKRPLKSSSPTLHLVLKSTTKLCYKVLHLRVSWKSPGLVTQPLPWAAYSNAAWPFQKNKLSLYPNLNLPWHNLRPFPIISTFGVWEKSPIFTSLQPPLK